MITCLNNENKPKMLHDLHIFVPLKLVHTH